MGAYRLKISFSSQPLDVEFPFNSTNEFSSKDLYFSENGKFEGIKEESSLLKVSCSLTKIDCHKEMFKPGHVRFELQFDLAAAKDLKILYSDLFKNSHIEITKIDTETGTKSKNVIAKNYYVFDYSISQVGNSKNSTYVTVNAYSPDKLLTLNKFSKAYIGKKLYEDVLKKGGAGLWTNLLKDKIKFASDDTKDIPVLMNFNALRYKESKDKDTGSIKYAEYIQPYLVQYDECPYDFLARTLNRCRECFYFESGALMFGWTEPSLVKKDTFIYDSEANTKVTGITIDKYDSIVINEQTVTSSTSTSLYTDYTNYEDFTKPSTDDNFNVFSAGADELLESIPSKTNFLNYDDYPKDAFLGTFLDCLNEKSLADSISTFLLVDTATQVALAEAITTQQKKYEKEYWEDDQFYKEERLRDYEKVIETKDDKGNIVKKTVSLKTDAIRAYSTGEKVLSVLDNLIIFDKDFYETNQQGIEKAESERVHVNLGTHFVNILLGSKVKITNKTYVVVSITEDCASSTCEFEAIPESVVVGTKTACFYPPKVADNSFIRVCKPQRAFVTANLDPLRMGRVQVRYPWQKVFSDGLDDKKKVVYSPWMRVTLPMASQESGFNFGPEINDEVIVNYENGNVEKPYVEGMVYNSLRKPADSDTPSRIRTIASRNGHTIRFTDPCNGTDAIKGFVPGWKFLGKFIPGMGCKLKDSVNDDFRLATGGIELSDRLGFYSIKMSSDNRTISVDSPLGNVAINAFKGISISAPLGDVHIEGKNICIEAGNNLVLKSGLYREGYVRHSEIDNQWLNNHPKTESVLTAVKDVLINFYDEALKKFQIIDFAFLRTLFEAFIRPVRGSLELKSYRFLYLEAGMDGKVNFEKQSDTYQIENYCQHINTDLRILITMFEGLTDLFTQYKDGINNSKTTFESEFGKLTDEQQDALDDLSSLKTELITRTYDANLHLADFVNAMNALNLKDKNSQDKEATFNRFLQIQQARPAYIKDIFRNLKTKIFTGYEEDEVEFKYRKGGADKDFRITAYKSKDTIDKVKRNFAYECVRKLHDHFKGILTHGLYIPHVAAFDKASFDASINTIELERLNIDEKDSWYKSLLKRSGDDFFGNAVTFVNELKQRKDLKEGCISFANKDHTYILDDKTIRDANEISNMTNINAEIANLKTILTGVQ